MATTIRELLVRLGVDADEKALADFDRRLEGVKTTMVQVTGVAVAGAVAIGAFAVSTAAAGDEVGKAAARIGLTAEELQEYEIAAGKAGASNEHLRDGLKEVSKRLSEARKGSKETAASFAALGIDINDTTATLPETFGKIADGIAKMNDSGEQIRLADRIAGEAGNRLLPLLKLGSEGIAKLREEARQTGGVMSNELVAASEQFNDSLADGIGVVKIVRNQIAAKLLPVLTGLINRGRDWFVINRKIIDQRIDKSITLITDGVEFLQRKFEQVNDFVEDEIGGWDVVFQQVAKAIGALAAAAGIAKFIQLLGFARAAVVAVGAVASAIGAPVVIAIGLGIAVLGLFLLAAEDVVVFLEGGRSVIGQFLAAFGLEEQTRDALLAWFKAAKENVEALWNALTVLVDIFGPTEEELDAINEKLEAVAKAMKDVVESGIRALLRGVRLATKDIGDFTKALDKPRVKIEAIVKAIEKLLSKVDALRNSKIGEVLGGTVGGRFAQAAGGGFGGRIGRGLIDGVVGRAQRGLAATAGAGGVSTSTSTSNTTNTRGGDTITIQTGANAQEVADALTRRDEEQRVAAMSAARGGAR